jgi:hypothetical protein
LALSFFTHLEGNGFFDRKPSGQVSGWGAGVLDDVGASVFWLRDEDGNIILAESNAVNMKEFA